MMGLRAYLSASWKQAGAQLRRPSWPRGDSCDEADAGSGSANLFFCRSFSLVIAEPRENPRVAPLRAGKPIRPADEPTGPSRITPLLGLTVWHNL